MTVAGQTQVVYTWDNANRLTAITQGSDVIGFAYDNANRRTSTTLANGVVQAYGYDNANQLTSITYTKGATTIGDLVYTYDAAGRRVKVSGSLARTNLPAAVNSASYNVNNQLTSWAGAAHSYDPNGNLTGDGSKTFTWNARDQLTALSGGASASFSYDGAGRRRSKTVAGTQTGFVYDELNFVQELTGATPKANLITGGLDELLLRKEAAGTRHPLTDVLGSVIALTDAAGAMPTEYTFEPFGSTTNSGAADTNSQRFTGREDDGAGIYHYRARYYSPTAQRFISEDPIGIAGGINLYGYVGSDPLGHVDPTGKTTVALGFGIGMGLGGPPGAAIGGFIGGVALAYMICKATGDSEECRKEWEDARERCRKLLSDRNTPRGQTGGHTNIEDCAKGHVSERCGGNPIDWGPKGRGRR